MTDPDVGFSIYISDRERERLEMERRKKATNSKPPAISSLASPVPPVASVAPISAATSSKAPVKEENQHLESSSSSDEAPEPTDEEIFLATTKLPIVSVSNISNDDTPWKAKHMQSMAASNRSICDNCDLCSGYETNDKSPGKCAACACDLIHHLKSIDMDKDPSDSDQSDEEEWEDDDDDEHGDDNDDDGDDGLGPAEPEEDYENDQIDTSFGGDDGGEDSPSADS